MWGSRPSARPSTGLRVALFLVDLFAAVTAIAGGFALATGHDTFPAIWLSGTPFTSYMIPGLILAVVVGGSAAVALVAILRSADAGARASTVAGAVMMGWIVGETLILNQPTRPSGSEVVYFAVGLAMAGLGLAIA
jgi:hypothetical protein